MKYAFIQQNHPAYSIAAMCGALSVSRGGYYSWCKRKLSQRAQSNEQLDQKIVKIYEQHKGLYGSPSITDELQDQGQECSENRVARRMKALQIQAQSKRKFKSTTDSAHDLPIAPNRLKLDFHAVKPNEKFGSDVTSTVTTLISQIKVYQQIVMNCPQFHLMLHLDLVTRK